MNPQNFANWFRLRGHKVIETETSFWHMAGPRTVQAFPYHWLICPGQEEMGELLQGKGLAGLRFSTPVESGYGIASYHVVYHGDTYEVDQLGKWARKNTRRGLRKSIIRPVSFDRIAEEGYEIQMSTLKRQSRRVGMKREYWRRMILAAKEIEGFEAWGAEIDGRLAASVLTFLMDDCIYMLYQQTHEEFLRDHVSNALAYDVTKTMVGRETVKSILYGLHSLDAPSSVDEFKFRMGYTPTPVRQRIVFHPWVSPIFASQVARGSSHLLARMFRNYTFTKAAGMIRFYQQGRIPLEQQSFPDPLEKNDYLLQEQ